ncbi:MAG: hypothetical protein WED04_08715 [Promethearchaeati archaeon SRVP18_Atabeyarchaeia-1]
MVPNLGELASEQIDLQGKRTRRGRIKYRKLFSRRSKKKRPETIVGDIRADSGAEAKVITWLKEHDLVFEAHGAIPHSRRKVDANKLVEEILSGFSSERRELLASKLKLKKIENNRSIGRYDFKVEGTSRSNGKHEVYYIEYWGLYNPNVEVTKDSLRKLYNRLLVNYTLIKKPLKEKYYRAIGLNLISLTRANLKKKSLDEKLGCLLDLDQNHLISKFMSKENVPVKKE